MIIFFIAYTSKMKPYLKFYLTSKAGSFEPGFFVLVLKNLPIVIFQWNQNRSNINILSRIDPPPFMK